MANPEPQRAPGANFATWSILKSLCDLRMTHVSGHMVLRLTSLDADAADVISAAIAAR
jgi:hypothetical protein